MERQLKERIVGATVIVAAGIILIPWLLDGSGRRDEGPVEQTLTLPRQDGGTRSYTIPLDRPATAARSLPQAGGEPVAPRPDAGSVRRPDVQAAAPARPSAAAPSRPAPDAPDEPQPRATQPKPAAAPAQAVAQPASGGWAVQVGSFSQADNADRLRAQLERTGYTAFVSRAVTDAGTMHRVRVGPVEDRAAADKLQARLRTAGQQGRVVSLGD